MAATYLGCSQGKVRELVRAGELPIINLARDWRIDRFDLDKFIETNRQLEA